MGSFSLMHWSIVLVIVMKIFGTRKLRNIGADLGGAVRGFKDGIKDGEATEDPAVGVEGLPTSPRMAGRAFSHHREDT